MVGRPVAAAAALFAVAAALATACTADPAAADRAGSPSPSAAVRTAGTYTNPVYDHDAPDPAVLRVPGGWDAYTTQSVYTSFVEVPTLRSADLVHWHLTGDALPHPGGWALSGSAGDVWAPDVVRLGGRYLLYFSGREYRGDNDLAIGVATSASPAGPFRDVGHPILRHTGDAPDFAVIDPFVLTVHGRHYLYYGSGFQPIRVARLSGDGLRVLGRGRPVVQPVGGSGPYSGLVEGPWVLPHDGWYYLMYSVGDCCSDQANYTVGVSRSRSPLGPFTPDPDNPILQQNKHFWAPGHNATVTDDAGQDWIVYHARVRGSPVEDRLLMLDRIVWRHGWPTVNDGHGPSWTPQPVPAI